MKERGGGQGGIFLVFDREAEDGGDANTAGKLNKGLKSQNSSPGRLTKNVFGRKIQRGHRVRETGPNLGGKEWRRGPLDKRLSRITGSLALEVRGRETLKGKVKKNLGNAALSGGPEKLEGVPLVLETDPWEKAIATTL